MLNKIKKNILPMLDTLGDALIQYLSAPASEMLNGIIQFIDAINAPLAQESDEATALSAQLKASLESPVLAEVERIYNEFCTAVENLPVQYKAVFLPYYDNTWDSLASVYEAFAADPMFVTEIVIIPIRRNTPSGWKMVYEDYLTPKGIPNTHFSKYSFESDLPDFVFYNNPYDGVNIEKFQSQNIKQYAGRMVYVPYFLYRHMLRSKDKVIWETEQRTQLPGHDNADIIVAQGKSFMATFAHRSRNGNKMVSLGNPKTDNIYKYMHDYPRYEEWDKATGGKKVFFLNTHYSSFIDGSYRGFLPDLIEAVEQNNDISLIWRPHPQSFLMLDEKHLTENYIELQSYMDKVSKHERMILDTTASDVSAIMYSDAVVSQQSSVIAEAVFANKPIFILAFFAPELVTPGMWETMTVEDYMQKLNQARKYDEKKLFLFSAACYAGLWEPAPKEMITREYMLKSSLHKFICDIQHGVDSKKKLRSIYREQLFDNGDGTCGQKIHDYIANQIEM